LLSLRTTRLLFSKRHRAPGVYQIGVSTAAQPREEAQDVILGSEDFSETRCGSVVHFFST
jgi:hypothetical protein